MSGTVSLTSRPGEIGLALAADRLIAHVSTRSAKGRSVAWERPIESLATPIGQAELTIALTELRETLGVSRARASVALLPGLVQLRRIRLPRMRDDELRTVLARDAARYFFGAREPHVIAFRRLVSGRTPMVPLVVACAPEAVVETLLAAASDSSWDIDRIVPAHAAWMEAAVRRWPELRRERGQVVVAHDTTTEVLAISRGALELTRRTPRPAADGPATTMVFPQRTTESPSFTLDEPRLIAASYACRTQSLELLPQRLHDARSRRTRLITRFLLAAAAACFVSGALLELWGTRREVQQVETRRAAIRARVDGVMRVRDALGTVDRRVAMLATLDRTAPQWSTAMATVASHLPLDAHLAAFRGRADSLVLEGTAERATGVFEAIQRAPGVSGVRANAPIRQELDREQRPIEHFAVALRLAQPGSQTESKP